MEVCLYGKKQPITGFFPYQRLSTELQVLATQTPNSGPSALQGALGRARTLQLLEFSLSV